MSRRSDLPSKSNHDDCDDDDAADDAVAAAAAAVLKVKYKIRIDSHLITSNIVVFVIVVAGR